MNPILTVSILILVLTLCSCNATKSTPKRSEIGMTLEQRTSSTYKELLKNDNSKRSSFEKQAGIGKKDAVKTNVYKTHDFNSGKSFSNADTQFKTSKYSQAGKTSNVADKAYAEGTKESGLGDNTFHTNQSRLDGQTHSDSTKMSQFGNDTIRTNSNREGTKAMEKNNRPLINGKTTDDYSEGDIRKILNKN